VAATPDAGVCADEDVAALGAVELLVAATPASDGPLLLVGEMIIRGESGTVVEGPVAPTVQIWSSEICGGCALRVPQTQPSTWPGMIRLADAPSDA
jgi:hypothetical protein